VLAVAALEAKFWDPFCDVMEQPDLKSCDRHAMAQQSQQARQGVDCIVASLTLAEWQEKLKKTDCCVTPVLKLEDTFQHPHFRKRQMVHETMHPQLGPLTT
jgi:alpha-methylacyl-CoA racemase